MDAGLQQAAAGLRMMSATRATANDYTLMALNSNRNSCCGRGSLIGVSDLASVGYETLSITKTVY